MSDDPKISDVELFEVLPGLPGTGPIPEPYSATGQGTHREGFVVRFYPHTPESWVGNFQGGHGHLSGIFLHPDGRTLIVVTSGQAYHIDQRSRILLRYFGGCLVEAIQNPSSNLLIFADHTHLWAFGAVGLCWISERVSMDGIQNLRIEADAVVGEGFDPCQEKWHPFSVSLTTGKLKKRWRNFLDNSQ